MSRLHDPGPGEILDRLTILALKIQHGWAAGKPVAHWEAEHAALYSQVLSHMGTAPVLELAAVNVKLWEAEDELRAWRRAPSNLDDEMHATITCAFRIQELNDRRAELVTLINVNAGVDRPSDKL